MNLMVLFNLLLIITTIPNFEGSRQLLIFGKELHSKSYEKQINIFSDHKSGMKERDLMVVEVNQSDVLNKKYSIKPNEFIILLIGKDGTEKYRTTEWLSAAKLFALIDAMPMRKSEMKKSGD